MSARPAQSLFSASALLCLWIGFANSQGGGGGPQCSTPSGKSGECVDIKLCPYLLDMLMPNISDSNLQYLRSSSCDLLNPSYVCCDRLSCATDEGQAGACVEQRVCRTRAQSTAGTCRGDGSVCCPRRAYDGYLSRKTGLPEFGFCGYGAEGSRLGNVSAPGQFPWSALLLYRSRQGEEERCGGALVSARFVLTAAHCIEPELVRVRLGVQELSELCTDVRGGCPFVSDVEGTSVVPTFDPSTLKNDIALVRLARPAPYANHIRPICLPDSTLPAALLSFPELTVAGWGVTQELSGNELEAADSRQIFVTVPMRAASLCRQALQMWANILATYQQPFDARVPDGALCAGGTFSGELCAQDSGGALAVAPRGPAGARALLALHSRSPAGCRAPVPAVYTAVLPHAPWIQRTIAKHYGIA